MPDVMIRDHALWVGDLRVPLFAGEMHYWRLSPDRWGAILDRFPQLGLNVVATYIPWEYHELAPGRFDFHGRTEAQRNLVAFLELVREKGLWLFIRPGPFIYAEWTNAGVPDRVVTMPRLSDEYRREARVWMQAVVDVLRPHFATQGGRIVLFQPDNEMDLFSHWFEGTCGLDGTQPGFFHDFLRAAYRDVAALNAAWGTRYERFDQAQAFAARVDASDPHLLTRHKDFWRFQHWATAAALRWHVDTYRGLGVDLPLVANYYPGGDVQNWREIRRHAGVDAVGIDWYPRNEFGGDAGEHRRFLDTCRMQRAVGPLPMIAEFECGVWHGYHDYVGALSPNHYRLMAVSALLAGVQAWNWYMFAGRDNWYYAPINERGELRPELAETFIGLHRVVRECDPPTLHKLTACSVVLEPLQIGTDWVLHANPVLDALYEADIDYEIWDPEIGRIEAAPADPSPKRKRGTGDGAGESLAGASRSDIGAHSDGGGVAGALARFAAPADVARPVMFYGGADWLARASQERLREYMEQGGTLVLFQHFPQRDEHFRPYSGLEVRMPDRVLSPLGKKIELQLGAAAAVAEGAVWNWDQPPGEPLWGTQVAGRQQAVENADKWMTNYIGRRWICGYREPRGRGALVVVGLPPTAELVRAVHRWLGLRLFAQVELAGVRTGLFERADEYYLFAANMNVTDQQVRVRLDGVELSDPVRVIDLWTDESRAMAPDHLVIDLARRSGGAWRIVSRA